MSEHFRIGPKSSSQGKPAMVHVPEFRTVEAARTWLGEVRPQVREATIRHPQTGAEVWFNHAAFWSRWSLHQEVRDLLIDQHDEGGLPFDTALGDGAPFTEAEIAAVNRAYEVNTVRTPWRAGDVMLVDNLLAAHGREAFRGNRSIVVAMGEPVELADCSPSHEPSAG